MMPAKEESEGLFEESFSKLSEGRKEGSCSRADYFDLLLLRRLLLRGEAAGGGGGLSEVRRGLREGAGDQVLGESAAGERWKGAVGRERRSLVVHVRAPPPAIFQPEAVAVEHPLGRPLHFVRGGGTGGGGGELTRARALDVTLAKI